MWLGSDPFPKMRGIRTASKIWLVGLLTGSGSGLAFLLAHEAFTQDQLFELWEFGVASATPALIVILVFLVTRSRVIMLLVIAYMTLLIPVLGATFGAAGSEPLWQFALPGFAGGLIWSTPFALWELFRKRKA